MKYDPAEAKRELDLATVLWYKQDQEDWELNKAIGIFKKYKVWHYDLQQPEWHDIKREAEFIGRCLDGHKGVD
jgi:hypothetical protein